MNLPFTNILKHLALCGTVIGLLVAGMISGHAQGIGFYLNSTAYTNVQGGAISGNVGITAVSDLYDNNYDGYGDTYYGFYTDWYVHNGYNGYDAPTIVEINGTGSHPIANTITQEVDFAAGNYGTVGFTISFSTNSSAGYDLTGTVSVESYDPYYNADNLPADNFPYDYIIDGNPYYYYCDYIYCDTDYYSPTPATLTVLNPNTWINISVVGSSQLMETAESQSTTIEFYRADSYNTRTVYFTVGGSAVNGEDYTASLTGSTGSVTLAAGQVSTNIDISTYANADHLEMYRSEVHYDYIARAVDALSCPVLANGNIYSAARAGEILKTTGAHGLMIGRGAIRNPWLFDQIRQHQRGERVFVPGGPEVLEYIRALYEAVCSPGVRESAQVQKMKKYLNFVGLGVEPTGQFLHRIRRVTTRAAFFTVCEEFLGHDQLMPLEPFALALKETDVMAGENG